MIEEHKKRISKFLSLVLRHKPELIGLNLDENGWADTKTLIKLCAKQQSFTLQELEEIVNTNDKKRFSFNESHTKIRANQGHSIDINLALKPIEPPEILYHGTISKFLNNIKSTGLLKMNRQHVHLSKDKETATIVGTRRGNPIILPIQANKMSKNGFIFYCSDNGVWLTDHVPAKYINFSGIFNKS